MVNFHKVLISTAIVFSVGFAVWSGKVYIESREVWALASAVGFGVATIAFVLYLRNLRRLLGEE